MSLFDRTKRALSRVFIHEVEVYRKQSVRIGMHWQERFVLIGRIQGRMTTKNPMEQEKMKVVNGEQRYEPNVVFFCFPADIQADDRLVFQNRLYEVVAEPRNPSFMDHHYEVPLEPLPHSFRKAEDGNLIYLKIEGS
ncbi:hypothetical protein [Parageobacillus thermoglucosidasius]|uniref:hypothetical protein n=1 Tax=Parageobacillus thermoglucosidasius TaxID=1426 RepID=UPI002E1CE841|nr:hypothetical protein [Parageobacillus thermoglucosidasius]MED4946496.1 hypothetical protein [Parageobacillus thermoglucosidasius]MED4984057.1 hypothetical protein [Parageobacillus thermoglucosidasius]